MVRGVNRRRERQTVRRSIISLLLFYFFFQNKERTLTSTANYIHWSHIGVSVTNNNGFWIQLLDLLELLYNYNQL
jgi:hypothetical protein